MTPHSPTSKKGVRGQSVVEFALTLPISLLLIMGLVIFAIALARLESVENAASEGARTAQRWRPGGPETCVQAVHSAVARSTPFSPTVTITGSCPTDTVTRVTTGSLITVQVLYNYQPIFLGTMFRDMWEPPSTWPLQAQVSVMHE